VVLPSFFAAFSKLWGFLADRFGARKLFILLGWFSSAFALIPPLFEPCFETVFISGVVGSALWSVGAPALTAEVMGVKKQGTRLGVWRSLGNAAYLAGVACAGALYDAVGMRGVLAVCLAIYMVAGSTVAIAYKPDRGGTERVEKSPLKDIVADLKHSLASRRSAPLAVATLVIWISVWSVEGLSRAKVLRVLGSEAAYSFAAAAAVAIDMLAAPLTGRFVDRCGPIAGVMLGLALHTASGIALACLSDPLLVLIAWCVPFGYALTCSLYVAFSRVAKGLADAVGTCDTLVAVAALPATLVASLADHLGLDAALAVLSALSLAAIPPLAAALKSLRESKDLRA